MNIVIIGGGTAGWMAAGFLKKKNPDYNITLIESPGIPKIGVGESVTPHVAVFFAELGVPTEEWMLATGAIYKFGNKFVNWRKDPNYTEYFSFEYPLSIKRLYKDAVQPSSFEDLFYGDNEPRTIDAMLKLHQQGRINKFDQYMNSQHHYMDKNIAPFDGDKYLLNPLYSWTQHINAELAANYIRDHIAVPLGVKHIKATVQSIQHTGDIVSSVELDDGSSISGNLFVDASGFHRVMIKHLDRDVKLYKNNVCDSAWVCQIDYEDPEKEMLNYTSSIAKDDGWYFKIGLYHRMGLGYVFSSQYTTPEKALETYYDITKDHNKRFEPRLIKWIPNRLEEAGKGNVAAVGLSCGFVEPMEANALYIIINSIRKLNNVLEKYRQTRKINFNEYNSQIAYATDDIADFILTHYTLSDRGTSDFWNDMRAIGVKEKHKELVYSKIMDKRHTMRAAWDGLTMWPDYLWAELAMAWGIVDESLVTRPIDDRTLDLAELHFKNTNLKHDIVSGQCQNNFQWLKQNIFNGMMPHEWEETYLG